MTRKTPVYIPIMYSVCAILWIIKIALHIYYKDFFVELSFDNIIDVLGTVFWILAAAGHWISYAKGKKQS